MIVERDGYRHHLHCEEGIPIGEITKKKISSKDAHGTTIRFIPSEIFLGKCAVDIEDIKDWLDKLSYQIPSKIKINFTYRKGNKDIIPRKTFQNKKGMFDYIKDTNIDFETDIVHVADHSFTTEKITDSFVGENNKVKHSTRDVKREIMAEVAFGYSTTLQEFTSTSFCNFVNTIEGGVHVNAAKQAIGYFMLNACKKELSEREMRKLEIQFSDAIKGLYVAININTDLQPQFSSQTKHSLSSDEFFKPIRLIVTKALDEYFKVNPNVLKKCIAFIKMTAKIRLEANRVRASVIKGETNILAEHSMENFVPANNRGKHQYRELIIIEGKSAMGIARLGRFDNNSQAIFAIRGVPKNSFALKLNTVLDNEEFKGLVSVLKTNIGNKFDMDKLFYDKIIIMTDADIDGHRICSLLCTFFLCHMPELVKAGKIYKAVSPLYKLKDKKDAFALNKQDYIDIFERKARNNITLTNPKTRKVLTNNELKKFLFTNREFLESLDRSSKHYAINPVIIENLAMSYTKFHSDKNPTKWVDEFNKIFQEIKIDEDHMLTGIFEGKYQICKIDELFYDNISGILDIFESNDELVYEFTTQSNNCGLCTIGEIMRKIQKFQPIVETRFKGLGELEPEELRATTLDPRNRILIQMAVSDMEDAIKSFAVLHGSDNNSRKEMMKLFKINREDIDN
ncbi:MAG: toprim domain-containing protein [Herbinix sp.]|nr:toprim domain-containing protein [Herbinix sp.]